MSKQSYLPANLVQVLDNKAWRRRQYWKRWWVYPYVFLIGPFYFGFLAANIRSKKSIFAAAASSLLFVLFIVLNPGTDEAESAIPRPATFQENVYSAIVFTMIAFNIWMLFFLKNEWLVWRAKKEIASGGSWVENNLKIKTVGLSKSPTRENRSGDDLINKLQADSSELIEPNGETAVVEPLKPAPKIQPKLELNSASANELLDSGLLSEQQISALVSIRTQRSITSDDDLRMALSLKPHEFLKVEGKFLYSIKSESRGRILDV